MVLRVLSRQPFRRAGIWRERKRDGILRSATWRERRSRRLVSRHQIWFTATLHIVIETHSGNVTCPDPLSGGLDLDKLLPWRTNPGCRLQPAVAESGKAICSSSQRPE